MEDMSASATGDSSENYEASGHLTTPQAWRPRESERSNQRDSWAYDRDYQSPAPFALRRLHSNATDPDSKDGDSTAGLVGAVFGVFLGFLLLLLILKWLSRHVHLSDAQNPHHGLRLNWRSLLGRNQKTVPEVVRRGSTVFVQHRRGSQISEASVDMSTTMRVNGRKGSADSGQARNPSRSMIDGSRTPLLLKEKSLDFLPIERIYAPVAREELKAEYVTRLIMKRRGQMMVISNLARSLGKSQTAGLFSDLDNTVDFHTLGRQLAEKTTHSLEASTANADQRGHALGATSEQKETFSASKEEEYYAFSFLLLLAVSFLLLGRHLNLLVGPEYASSDQSLNTVLLLVCLILQTEFTYNILYKKLFVGSFFFWIDLLVIATTVPEVVQFFDEGAFDDFNDDGPWSQTSIRGGEVALGVKLFGDGIRVFKIYGLIKRSWAFLQFFKPRRETVVGQLVSIGIKQKVSAIVLALLFIHIFLPIVSRTYDHWPNQSWDDELRRMQLLLVLSGNVPSAEPFLSFASRWISHHNCEDGVQIGTLEPKEGMRVVELDRSSDAHCYVHEHCIWPDAQIAAREDTTGCRLRYLRVNGIDIWGEGPSGLTWMQDLRAYPSERIISYTEHLDDVALCPHSTLSAGRGVLSEALEHGTVSDNSDPIDGDPCTMLVLESRVIAKDHALKGTLTIIVLALLLGTFNYFFFDLGRRLVVEPILEMVDLVKEFSVNPMADVDQRNFAGVSSDTKYIGRSLFKLSNLLQVAYGEVGSHVIQHNLASDQAINAMVPGSRHNMIIGFCDIRSFTTCTEGLEDEVMVYVNKIADYIHVAVSDNDGHPNKNIGDAFQVAWQIPALGMARGKKEKYIGDSALRSFIRIIVETTSCPKLLRLTSRDEVQARIPGYATKMGFGLHAGWAIQGAVGSEHKIDLAWLSPHVQWAERLEFATKLYKVPILMSDAFREHLSPKVQRLCRRVDRVKVPDSAVPMDLYTYDVRSFDLEDMSWPPSEVKSGNNFFSQFPPIYRPRWCDAFQTAVSWYVDGQWDKAEQLLQACLVEVPEDGPCHRLLEFMKSESVGGAAAMQCPQAWKGYRETSEF